MSATIIARSVAAMPKRSAVDTWAAIIGIIAPDPKDPAREELGLIGGVASSIIAADAPKDDPMVIFGGGPRLRIYCLYNDDAILGDKVSEDPVRQTVTGSGWQMSLPCHADDLEWVQRKLKSLSSRVTARKLGEEPPSPDESDQSSKAAVSADAQIDIEEFMKP